MKNKYTSQFMATFINRLYEPDFMRLFGYEEGQKLHAEAVSKKADIMNWLANLGETNQGKLEAAIARYKFYKSEYNYFMAMNDDTYYEQCLVDLIAEDGEVSAAELRFFHDEGMALYGVGLPISNAIYRSAYVMAYNIEDVLETLAAWEENKGSYGFRVEPDDVEEWDIYTESGYLPEEITVKEI